MDLGIYFRKLLNSNSIAEILQTNRGDRIWQGQYARIAEKKYQIKQNSVCTVEIL